jgi:hypothetical protein
VAHEVDDQYIIARFVQGDLLLDERRYADMDEIPAIVEIGGERYSTIGVDPTGREAWHRKYSFRDDGTAVYRLDVVCL